MSCRTKTLPTTSFGFTTSAGTRKLRPGLFFVSISEETYLSPIATWSVKTWNREPVNHQLPHLHRYRRGSDRRNWSNPGRAPHSPSSPPLSPPHPRFFSFRLKNQPPTMPKIIVGDGSTLEEGCILDYVTFRHHPGQTPAQRAGAGGFFPRRDMMIMIGSDGARPGSSSLAGPSFCNQASAKPSHHHPPSLGLSKTSSTSSISVFPALLQLPTSLKRQPPKTGRRTSDTGQDEPTRSAGVMGLLLSRHGKRAWAADHVAPQLEVPTATGIGKVLLLGPKEHGVRHSPR